MASDLGRKSVTMIAGSSLHSDIWADRSANWTMPPLPWNVHGNGDSDSICPEWA